MEKDATSASSSTTPIPKYKPLSELTLSSPHPVSFKSLTSRARDIYFHDYANEPALFTIEIPDSYPSPITLLLQQRSPTATLAKSTIAKCVPAHAPGEKAKRWEIVVPLEDLLHGSKDAVLGAGVKEPDLEGITKEKAAKTSMMERFGKDSYHLTAPWITQEESKTFQWHRLSTPSKINGRGPSPASFSNPDWKLINPATQEVHAVSIEKWGATERGSMQFRRSFGREWELSIVLSIGLIVEHGRRRKGRRGSFLGGFGGGGVGAASAS